MKIAETELRKTGEFGLTSADAFTYLYVTTSPKVALSGNLGYFERIAA